MLHLEIDYRERDIITIFQENEHSELIIKTCNLIVGDFLIKNENNDILFAIERKSFKDLCASIIDNRFRDQKERLLESINNPSKIIYILEGIKEPSQGISIQTINSAILNLLFKHNYKVIFTNSKQDTVNNILSLCNKLNNKDYQNQPTQLLPIKLVKKSDKLYSNIFINMLSVIPGVSINTASKIQKIYNTMHNLIYEYNNISDELRENMLSNIEITPKRKLGNALSKKIFNAIYQEAPKIINKEECLLD